MNITRPATGFGWLIALLVLILVVILLIFQGIGAPAWLPLLLLGLLAFAVVIG